MTQGRNLLNEVKRLTPDEQRQFLKAIQKLEQKSLNQMIIQFVNYIDASILKDFKEDNEEQKINIVKQKYWKIKETMQQKIQNMQNRMKSKKKDMLDHEIFNLKR